MFINATLHKTSAVVMTICTLLLCAGALIYSKECSGGAVRGIEMCLGVLVPSLFPFMALSAFIVKSGMSETLGKPFKLIMNKLFGLDSCFAPIILLALIGGYPVGAKGISSLYESRMISEHQAKKALMFAVCSGPGFLINFVGMSIYKNKLIGFIILVSQIVSVILIGVMLNLFDREKEIHNSSEENKACRLPLSNAVVESAYDSAKGILNICIFVVLFSAFCGILESIIGDGIFKNCLLCFLEVCSAISTCSENSPIEMIAFAAGFGGLCVHFQIYSALGKIRINKLLFFCIRIIQGVLTAVLTHFGLRMLKIEAMVFSTGAVENASTSGGTILSGAVLVLVMLCFLYILSHRRMRNL